MENKKIMKRFFAGMAVALIVPMVGASVFSGSNASASKFGKYYGEYTEKNSYIKHGEDLNGRMADEGFVLLKNDGSLPMEKGSKISLVGKASTNLARGGAGSGAGSVSGGVTSIDLQKSLADVGFIINDHLTSFYKNDNQSGKGRTNGNTGWRGISEVTIGETPLSSYSDSLLASLDEYNDAIIQVLTREGSEGCDNKMVDCRDNNDAPLTSKHGLELSDNEQALFNEIKNHTDHVIIVINSSNIFECDAFMNDPKVSGILWIGNPGDVGPGAVGRILCGDVNPSGRTVDTWTRDFTKDPTFQNFSDNQQHFLGINEDGYVPRDTMLNADGTPMRSYGTLKSYTDTSNPSYGADSNGTHIPRQFSVENEIMPGGLNGVKPAAYVSYEEGIYLDYRYYETRYADMAKTDKAAADEWYNGEEGVVFPFGYGLSYTTFTQEIVGMNYDAGAVLTESDKVIELSVKVTNTGTVAGKDAVQIYWKAPYLNGEIEKADHVLCAFDKTELIEPGESEVVNLKFYIQDVASYDAFDKNNNGFKGYELDGGNYEILLAKNAHEMYQFVDLKVKSGGIQYRTDRFTGEEVVNRFTDRGFHNTMPTEDDIEFTQFSRADFEGTFPSHPTDETRKVTERSRYEEFLTHKFNISEFEIDKNFETIPEEAYKTEEDAREGGWKQSSSKLSQSARTQLSAMKDVPLGDERWEDFINEFTWDELLIVLERNQMSSKAINEIGKPGFSEGDGPQKYSIIWWVSSPIIAATFNPRLAHEQGEAVGMEAHIQNKSGWWGPGINTHRSPFGGRNFEYYSADPFLMGRMAAQVIEAATDAGVYVYLKHFAVNDQEKNRESGISFLSEQTLREIYLKSFQMVFEEAKPMGVMSSYNRIGLMETAASYPLLTEVLRGEWGFKGSVLSDMTHSGNSNVDFDCYETVTNRVLAGCNAQLDSGGFSGQIQAKWDSSLNAPTCTKNGQKVVAYSFWYAARQRVIEHMYMSVNCVAMNRGLDQVIANKTIEAKVNEATSYEISSMEELAAGAKVGNSEVVSIESYELANRLELPEGIVFENGVISGEFKESGLYYFAVRVNLVVADANGTESQMTAVVKVSIDVSPDVRPVQVTRPTDPSKPSEGLPVGAIVGIAGGVVVALAAAGVFVFLKKKKIKA